ncbi:probable cinnamyl alcohol dehydrogenase 1 [Herrania umbratica]|uniref:Probable cinnamyl alcohol dehydrogenase 1 n=1 Tax=Herrania umbratica TaxID=108875 RepID=A0A6J0ZF13_9ROSI|nr:probable cinnamyl alcohol dehydrogenase 1 [Herrania umbratica]
MERSTMGWAAQDASEILSPYTYTLRNTGAEDIFLKALYCGVCHTDIHKTRGQGNHVTSYPMVSGHEVVGEVMEVGADATKFIVGDHVGVGYFVGSCGTCLACEMSQMLGCFHWWCFYLQVLLLKD